MVSLKIGRLSWLRLGAAAKDFEMAINQADKELRRFVAASQSAAAKRGKHALVLHRRKRHL